MVIETVFPFQLGSMDRHLNTRRVVWTEAGIFCQWPSPGEGRRRGDAFLSFAETRLPPFLMPCHFPSTKTHAHLRLVSEVFIWGMMRAVDEDVDVDVPGRQHIRQL